MPKFGFVFPGQGSQKPGMGKDLYDNYEDVRNLFEQASNTLNRDIAKICFEGTNEELRETTNAQPSIFLVSAAIYSLLTNAKIQPTLVAGHSLGEISAYYASGVFNLETALDIIDKRGKAMAGSYPADKSAMAAVLGLESSTIEETINNQQEQVVIANYNCPGQYVISGEKAGVERISEFLIEKGGKVITLNVSGPFHSPLMEKGANEFKQLISSITMKEASLPIILNRTASPEENADALKESLPLQIKSSVKWIESIQYMAEQVDIIIECGPGRVLSGLIKKIAPDTTIKSVNNVKTFQNLLEEIKILA
jgi:[acyl-carrier-protein] S-malonyltransferase